MHTVFALLCFVVVIHWLIFPYPSGLLHWHCGNLTIAPVPAKKLWWIWMNTSCEFIMNDCITTTKQSTTKPCAYFLGYTVPTIVNEQNHNFLHHCIPFQHAQEQYLNIRKLSTARYHVSVATQEEMYVRETYHKISRALWVGAISYQEGW